MREIVDTILNALWGPNKSRQLEIARATLRALGTGSSSSRQRWIWSMINLAKAFNAMIRLIFRRRLMMLPQSHPGAFGREFQSIQLDLKGMVKCGYLEWSNYDKNAEYWCLSCFRPTWMIHVDVCAWFGVWVVSVCLIWSSNSIFFLNTSLIP